MQQNIYTWRKYIITNLTDPAMLGWFSIDQYNIPH